MSEAPAMRDLLGEDTPTNWGKWGPDDELGCLNYLDAAEVLRGVQHIKSGEVFTLQIQMGRSESPGDPLWPGREGIQRQNELDESTWDGEGAPAFPGGLHYADDTARIFLQGSTQYDALGHVWYDGKLWNGYDARSTIGAMEKASVLPIAEKGIVGRGVLIDMARHRGKQWLDKGETFDHNDLEAAAEEPGRGDPAARHPGRPYRLDEVLVRAQRPEELLRRLRRARPDLLPRARGVVPVPRGAQPGHRHHRQRGHRRPELRGRAAAALRADAQPRVSP